METGTATYWGNDLVASADDAWWQAVMEQGEYASYRSRSERRNESARYASERAGSSGSADGGGDASLDWATARQVYESDQTVELAVVGFNRGGLLVGWGALRGFVPASHIVAFPSQVSEEERKAAFARRIGGRMTLKVIEFDPANGRIVLSERAAQAGPGRRTQVLEKLQPGDITRGVVTNVCDFGAFVDLGGVEGLIHVSEVSWGRVAHTGDALEPGQEVDVYVINVDRAHARIALSLKRLQPDPWATVEHRYTVGQVVEGKITHVVPFGAFACLEEGLEGLIHVSELAEGSFMHPRNIVQEGEVVRARIMSIDGEGRRIGLSLRRADNRWAENTTPM
ncbi:MAG: S1 RNA-binding domain-containing protein [Chloroflexi bacterium]|nr:S1 RNA-binding domain-containing protein [Chloroflexota bacterium]